MESCSYDVYVSNPVPPDLRGGESDSLVKIIYFSHTRNGIITIASAEECIGAAVVSDVNYDWSHDNY